VCIMTDCATAHAIVSPYRRIWVPVGTSRQGSGHRRSLGAAFDRKHKFACFKKRYEKAENE
jgi:hypothetical protein